MNPFPGRIPPVSSPEMYGIPFPDSKWKIELVTSHALERHTESGQKLSYFGPCLNTGSQWMLWESLHKNESTIYPLWNKVLATPQVILTKKFDKIRGQPKIFRHTHHLILRWLSQIVKFSRHHQVWRRKPGLFADWRFFCLLEWAPPLFVAPFRPREDEKAPFHLLKSDNQTLIPWRQPELLKAQ